MTTHHADFLKHRRSTKLAHMTSPAPTGDELQSILQTTARVPDLALITNHWTENAIMDNKGESYNKDGLGLPQQGFQIDANTNYTKDG